MNIILYIIIATSGSMASVTTTSQIPFKTKGLCTAAKAHLNSISIDKVEITTKCLEVAR